MKIEHWMMFATFAQQNFFEYPCRGTYSGVIINANIAAHAPTGLSSFLLEKTASNKYVIDPLTHAFQHDPKTIFKKDGSSIKTSILDLANAYGKPISSIVGNRPILPEDFKNDKVLNTFVENCINYQINHLTDYMLKDKTTKKYLYDLSSTDLQPHAVISPYLYMTESAINEWLPINLKLAKKSVEYCKTLSSKNKVYTSIVIDHGILIDSSYIERIIDKFLEIELDGFLLWIDNFYEITATKLELTRFLELCKGLRNKNRDVINLHGSYFSIIAAGILGNNVLTGVTHGPEFGEFRGVIPVGGGIPIARYYLPLLHSRERYVDVVRILTAKGWLKNIKEFYKNVCDCDVCKETMGNDINSFTLFGESETKSINRRGGMVTIEFPTKETTRRCLEHYLQRKKKEFDFIINVTNPEDIYKDLERGYNELKDILGLDRVGYLQTWITVFQNWNKKLHNN